jgi:uncharacterized protein (DUF1697 family)
MTRQIALLRGINLGAHKRVAMGELRELLGGLGYEDVRTHLQSGNVVLSSEHSAERLQRDLQRAIASGLGVDTPVIVRSSEELVEVIRRDPFGKLATEPKRYQVSFLSAEPEPAVAAMLATADVAPERVVLSGREVYAWHPEGIQRSSLAKLLSDRRLGVTATARNWNTVLALLALAEG